MVAEFDSGEAAIRGALNGLITKGYVRRLYERERGKVVAVHYLVIGADGEFPQVGTTSRKTKSGFPTSGSATSGEPGSGETSDDTESAQVAATSRKTTFGSTTSGFSHPKKTITKKTKVLEDQEDHSLSTAAIEPAGLAPVAALRERDDPATPTTTPEDPAVAIIVKHCPGITTADAHTAVERIKANEDVRTVTGLVITASRNGTLPALIAEALTATTSSTTPGQPSYGDHTRAVANKPACGHGYPGGHIPIPGTLWSPCSLCRRDAGWTANPEEVAA
jgi:hypothetical protein